jgi:hypothetical protein
MKKLLISFVLALIIQTTSYAFELENRIPASVWELDMRFQYTPTYSRAFNGYGQKAPLQQLMLWDREWYDSVEGELQRQEQRFEISMAYGLTEIWMIEATVPLVQKNQTSSLSFVSATSSQQKVLDSLASETQSGLGDISLQIAKDLSATTTWHNRGGFTLRLPTGNSGTRRGIASNAIGNGHSSVGGFFHFNWFPLTHGVRNGIRLAAANELSGKRETLEGVKVYYSAGHRADIFYNWSIERQNIFAGTELHYFQQSESKLPLGKSNSALLKEISFEFGYGNLSELEQNALSVPWQVRLGYTRPIAGQNTPVANQWVLSSTLYY